MPRPPRPARVDIVEYQEHERTIELWVRVAGHVISIGFPHHTIDDRKLRYGLARLDVVVVDGKPESYEVVDLYPDSDDRAIAMLVAEHLDRFERFDEDWTQQTPPDVAALRARALRRRTDRERSVDVPAKAEPQQPIVRQMAKISPAADPVAGVEEVEDGRTE